MRWVLAAILLLFSACTSSPGPTTPGETDSDTPTTEPSTPTESTEPAPDESWTYDAAVGDSWTWEGKITFNTQQPPPAGTRVWNARVAAFENLTVASGTYEAVRRDGTVTPVGGGDASTVTTWARASDYALLKHVVYERHSSGYWATTTTLWRQPCPEYEWPMAVGNEWTTDCTADVQSTSGGTIYYSGSFHLTTRYVVEALSATSVGDRTIPVYRLNETITGDVGSPGTYTAIVHVSPDACGEAVSVDTRGLDRGDYDLTAFECAYAA